MATMIEMPQMGYDMKEGTVVRWRKKEGDGVTRGEVIAEIETDKATVEMEAYSTGTLSKIVVEEGRTVPVGQLIAVITQPGEPVPPLEELASTAAAPAAPPQPAGVASPSPAAPAPAVAKKAPAPTTEVRATPIARRLAKEKGIDLTQVAGTGPGGRITEADVVGHEAAAEKAPTPTPAAAPTGGRVELTKMRQAIARVTAQSKREAPHFYVTSEIDMTEAMKFRKELNETVQDGTRVSVNDMVVKAVARALEKFPNVNATFQDDHLVLNSDFNIGIAVALEQGLMVPNIRRCQGRSLTDIAKASSELIQRAQKGTLKVDEYTGSTFSISNLGMFDVDSFAAIILPPNSAVLAVGTVKEEPVVRDGQVTIGQMMKATISVDHRVTDGAEGARFLLGVKGYLEHPVRLLTQGP